MIALQSSLLCFWASQMRITLQWASDLLGQSMNCSKYITWQKWDVVWQKKLFWNWPKLSKHGKVLEKVHGTKYWKGTRKAATLYSRVFPSPHLMNRPHCSHDEVNFSIEIMFCWPWSCNIFFLLKLWVRVLIIMNCKVGLLLLCWFSLVKRSYQMLKVFPGINSPPVVITERSVSSD